MNIAETISFDKEGEATPGGARGLIRKLFLSLLICLVAALSFGLGRLSGQGRGEPVRVEYDPALSTAAAAASAPVLQSSNGAVVGSKSGSKYHYPACPGAKQIKEANKISFSSKEVAEAAGYTLAANCKAP